MCIHKDKCVCVKMNIFECNSPTKKRNMYVLKKEICVCIDSFFFIMLCCVQCVARHTVNGVRSASEPVSIGPLM